ncbi:hypothetical protein PF010_g32944 [Phytophthora fragariae]|uniref:Acyltransferase 3 domain-containing protein n=1 Tax=Phytophthora fragariae TaxID=53985 RepID=A0A6A4AHN9_9STRA|nr:hypothetical protein PF003_g11599 [Phytophthora fragariae]KAE8948951.1 hypothetical protein PF009_g1474 [Phytophthora fragariae]KAE9053351.1 hypothetical protein PF010_g32944 [Phytophthora fragariae]KAE9254055.1 hypothetical protein PF004_g1201 [Phytophthora fragariae]KAE9256754.1 hypothetical protein PF002_g1657 [Phytophthora fragariae]
MLGSSGDNETTTSTNDLHLQRQDSDTHLSVLEVSDGETTSSTADSDDQVFVGPADKVPEPKPAPTNAAPTKVLFLDGIRGLAAILVVVQHSHEYPTQGLHLGSIAVDAFFVLSSFLLSGCS